MRLGDDGLANATSSLTMSFNQSAAMDHVARVFPNRGVRMVAVRPGEVRAT